MADGLWMGEELRFPPDIITETVLIIAKRGSGKTYSASVLVEEMVGAGLPACVLDPLGVWWGLRSSADGKSAGLPVIIIGGEHADLPLPADGAMVADLVIDERVPVVVDLSELSKTRQRAFVCAFLERLYHRNREPLHVVIDEADLFAPLRGGKDTMRLLGAYEDIVRRGRARGLGCTSITQRPAVLHTDIRSQAEVLIALRLIGTHDVAAIDEWVRLHATDEEARAVKASLPSLPVGTAWVWSPGWLELLVRVKIRQRRTFDSSATPKVGQQRIVPRAFAPVDKADLDRLAGRLKIQPAAEAPAKVATSAETARLRQEVTTLRARVVELEARPPERIEVPVLTDADRERMRTAFKDLMEITRIIANAGGAEVVQLPPKPDPPRQAIHPIQRGEMPRTERLDLHNGKSVMVTAPAAGSVSIPVLSKAQRAILTVLAQHPDGRTKRQLGMQTGYSSKGGSFNNALSSLRTAGFIDRSEPVHATSEGLAALGTWDPLPEGKALIDHWMGQVSKAEAEILRVLLGAWPGSLNKAELAARTDKGDGEPYAADGGSFNNALSKLRTLQLIDGYGDMRADDTLARALEGSTR